MKQIPGALVYDFLPLHYPPPHHHSGTPCQPTYPLDESAHLRQLCFPQPKHLCANTTEALYEMSKAFHGNYSAHKYAPYL